MTGISGIWVRCRYQVPDLSVRNQTFRWREPDSNLYGAFPVKRLFLVCWQFFVRSWKPFFIPSPAIRFAERAEGVKGPKR